MAFTRGSSTNSLGFSAKITGIKEIDRALKELEPKLAKQAIRKGMREGLKIMLKRARVLAPVGPSRQANGVDHKSGTLRKGIKIKSSRSRKGIRIAILLAKESFKNDPFYGAFQEEGAKKARIKPQHFLRKAFEETKNQVRDKTAAEIRSQIESIKWQG